MRNLLANPVVLAGAIALALPACSNDNQDDVDAAIADGDVLGSSLVAQADAELTGESDNVVAAKSAGIIIAIDNGLIRLAQFALSSASDANVLAFADREVAEHNDNLAALDALNRDLGVEPIESSVSLSIDRDMEGALRNVQSATSGSGSNAVDFQYMSSTLTQHTSAEAIVQDLIDRAPIVQLEVFLTDTETMLEDHAALAADILRNL